MRKAMANVHGFARHTQPNSLLTMSHCGQILFTQPLLRVPVTTSKPVTCLLRTSSNHGSRRGALRLYASSKEQSCQVRKKRQRLDEMCVQRFPQYSRTMIQSWILRGKVLVDGQVAGKAGMSVSDKVSIEITAEVPKYVCRAGYKLEAALEQLNIDVAGKVALDSGLSTGGFTDCLLQHGASFVYGVDVGYGQVMPAVVSVMKQESELITLIKPQFEARRSQVGKGGIVRDPEVHKEVLGKIIKGVEVFGFTNQGWIESPIKGAEGNVEFLAYFQRNVQKIS